MKFINDPLLELNDYRGTLRTMVGEATVSNEGLADSLRFLIPSTVDVLNSLYFSGNVPRMAQAAKARIEDLTESIERPNKLCF